MVMKAPRRRQTKTPGLIEPTAERRKQAEERDKEFFSDPRFKQMDEWARGDIERDAHYIPTPSWW